MSVVKRLLHDRAVGLGKVFSKFLPDRIPLTFAGAEATRELCGAIAAAGHRRLLVVTDPVLVEIGLVARVLAELEAAGASTAVYSGVEPDPTFMHIEQGLAQLEARDCDAVLAVGGGSSMDAAKVIAAAATNPGPVERLEGMFKVKQLPLPLYALPTTAGTGSEVTFAAVVSDVESHAKKFFLDPKLLPLIAALDPTLMTGLPPHVTAATGMDALTHAVESFLSRTATPHTEGWARTAVHLIFENLPRAYHQGEDLAARRAMALASYYAGLAFTRTSVGYVHAIAHTFGAHYGTPHGLANAIALPHVLDFSKDPAESRLATLAGVIGAGDGSGAGSAEAFIDRVRALGREVGIPPVLDALRADDIPGIARQALAEAHMNYPVPRYMSQPQCEELLGRVLS